jgi:hypothetical protein
MFDLVLKEFASTSYVRELGSRDRLELFAADGELVSVDYAVIGDIDTDEEVVIVGEQEDIRKIERREVEIEKCEEDQLYARAIIDGDSARPWVVDRVTDSGVVTTLHMKRRRAQRKRLRLKQK